MSMPHSAWVRTASSIARFSAASSSPSKGPPASRRRVSSTISGGRTRLPTCVVRIRSVLRFIPQSLLYSLSTRLPDSEALARVHDVRLDEGVVAGRPLPQLLHRPDEAPPVAHLLLAGGVGRGGGAAAPVGVIAARQGVVELAVGLDVWVDEEGLRREGGVRPAGRGDDRHAPGAALQ